MTHPEDVKCQVREGARNVEVEVDGTCHHSSAQNNANVWKATQEDRQGRQSGAIVKNLNTRYNPTTLPVEQGVKAGGRGKATYQCNAALPAPCMPPVVAIGDFDKIENNLPCPACGDHGSMHFYT